MCGIAGILGAIEPEDRSRVLAMNAIQNHRGPNAARIQAYEDAVLGHTRLSIIDLSERGLQPMESGDGRHILVFNGEIYNYRELREELAGEYRFRGDSDSEVLLAAFQKWGEKCLDRLNGMFAFCIYDRRERTAFLARDRFGQKPYFYAASENRLIFSSEVKAILAAGIVAKPDRDTWARYLIAADYDDGAATFFAGISQLRPGECAWYEPGTGLRRRVYYRVAEHVEPLDVEVGEATAHIRELLIDAARIHMRADVPIGVSLSGGLDSSCLLACLDLAGELHEGVGCFSVDFGRDFSERKWIEAAANHHRLPSHIDSFSIEEFPDSIRPMMWHMEGPIGGLINCGLERVAANARLNGVTVIQDGTGLDEAFGGYRNHHNLYLGLLLQRGDPEGDAAVAGYARNWGVSEDAARAAAAVELKRTGTTIDGTIPVRPELLDPAFLASYPIDAAPGVATGDRLRDALIDYLQVRKIPRSNRMKDRISMAHGRELRLPFLDHRLVEYALSLPGSYYFLGGRSKSIVREALAGAMDDSVRTAAKRSIQAPQGPWLRREPMRSYVQDLIESESFADRGLFDVAAARRAFGAFCAGAYDNSFFVWQWVNAEEWFRMFIDGDAVTDQNPLCPDLATSSSAPQTAVAL